MFYNGANLKYKLRPAGIHIPRGPQLRHERIRYFQLIALRDIPEHGVTAGDFGGYVSDKNTLSHDGTCWIGEEAEVVGKVSVQDDAYIGGTVSVVNCYNYELIVKDRVRIIEDSRVRLIKIPGKPAPKASMVLSGNAEISGMSELFNVESVSGNVKIHEDAHLFSCKEISGNVELFGTTLITGVGRISGDTKIHGSAILEFCHEISGEVEIFGNTKLEEDVNVLGKSKIHDSVVISKGSLIRDSDISGNVTVLAYERIFDAVINDEETLTTAIRSKEIIERHKADGILAMYQEILDNIHSYESDIVKIIKYPVMTDRTDPHTLQMVLALNATRRLIDKPWESEFKEAVKELEAKFLMAESNAIRMAGTTLSETDRKKTQKAKDLLNIAANENANENEKKLSFEQAFKQLEGIITVPEVAVDTFRLKIGLKELEA